MATDREPRQDRTRQNNDVTTLGLGALAWLDRLAAASAPRGPAPVEGPLLTAALGLMSLRRSLRRWAQQAAQAPAPEAHAPAPEARPPGPEALPFESLMR